MPHFAPPTFKKGVKKLERIQESATNDATWDNRCKLKFGRFTMDVRKKFLSRKVVQCWSRQHRDMVDSPSLEIFEIWLDKAIADLIWCSDKSASSKKMD